MIKPDFSRSTDEATRLLNLQIGSITQVDVTKLSYDKEIYFFSIQEYCEIVNKPLTDFISPKCKCLIDGCTFIFNGVHLVLHNEKLQTKEHLNWTRAHEIGHIYLDHKSDGDIEEIEAHFFAAQLLMPVYSIAIANMEYGKLNYRDIMNIFGVSKEAAIKRKRTMDNINFFGPSQEDWMIWSKQKMSIEQYYNKSHSVNNDVCIINI